MYIRDGRYISNIFFKSRVYLNRRYSSLLLLNSGFLDFLLVFQVGESHDAFWAHRSYKGWALIAISPHHTITIALFDSPLFGDLFAIYIFLRQFIFRNCRCFFMTSRKDRDVWFDSRFPAYCSTVCLHLHHILTMVNGHTDTTKSIMSNVLNKLIDCPTSFKTNSFRLSSVKWA